MPATSAQTNSAHTNGRPSGTQRVQGERDGAEHEHRRHHHQPRRRVPGHLTDVAGDQRVSDTDREPSHGHHDHRPDGGNDEMTPCDGPPGDGRGEQPIGTRPAISSDRSRSTDEIVNPVAISPMISAAVDKKASTIEP